jgi:hypothetical protein
MYKIVILMFLLDPTADDALEVEFKNGKVLEFEKIEQCYEHIYNNFAELRAFAHSQFGPATPLKSINCFKKNVGA